MHHLASRPSLRLFVASALVVALAGCARCGGANKSAEEFVGQDSTLVVSVPHLGQLADRTQQLLTTVRGGAGGQQAVAVTANLARQLGFDPLTRDGQKAAGLDPNRSLAIGGASQGSRTLYAALPYSDKATLEATIERLAKDRTGAGVKETREVNGQKVTVLTTAAGGAPQISYLTTDGFVLLAVGDLGPDALSKAAVRKPEESVAKAGTFAQAKTKVGERDLYVFLPRSASLKLQMMPDVMTLGIGVSANELAVRAYVALPPERQQAVASALVGGGDQGLTRLPKGQPIYVRGGMDWTKVAQELQKDEEGKQGLQHLRDIATEAGIDLDQEVLANLEPGFALSFGIASTANLSTAFDLDPRRQNPFENYTVIGVGKVKDAAKAQATLKKLSAVVEKYGTTVAAKDVGGSPLYTANYKLGQGLSWTLRGNELVLIGGYADQMEQVLGGLGKNALAQTDFAQRAREALFQKTGFALGVDFSRIGETVNKLPSESFGTGPGALMARSLVEGIVQPLARLKAVLAITPVEGGLNVDLATSVQ